MYENNKTYNVIKGKVPDFRNYSKNDVNLIALKVNGESTNIVPQKANYENITVECDNDAMGTWDYENWTLILSNLKKVPTSCSVNFVLNIGFSWVFNYTGDEQSFITPTSGRYKIELWGADGGIGRAEWSTLRNGGKGGYTAGEINLNAGQSLYVYVGEKGGLGGLTASSPYKYTGGLGGYNGGGKGGDDSNHDTTPEPAGGGGGATDIRLVNGDWNNFESLKSRIMVAGAGGGGAENQVGNVGGSNTVTESVYQFGIGGAGVASSGGGGAGGGGYMGGKSNGAQLGGSGGTSYISGHDGCKTIDQNATNENLVFTEQSQHYSGLYFTNTQMIDGSGFAWTSEKQDTAIGLPTPEDTSGNGYAKITYLGK